MDIPHKKTLTPSPYWGERLFAHSERQFAPLQDIKIFMIFFQYPVLDIATGKTHNFCNFSISSGKR
jgi:hypothetical protein